MTMVRDNKLRAFFRQIKYIFRANKAPRRRLELEHEKPRGGKEMIKGLSKRIIVVKCPDKELFEEAIFIIREDVFRHQSDRDVLTQAQQAANDYVKRNLQSQKRIIAKLTPPAYLAAGAAVTAMAWLAVSLAGF